MHRIMVAGIGTDVGKTVVSAILAILLKGDYWKPVQCGEQERSDTAVMKKWLGSSSHTVYPPAYSLKAPLSPHHAARLENVVIDLSAFHIPTSDRPLVIEGVGGILVPLTSSMTTMDLFKSWKCQWVIVSKNYLGSINHTLITIDVLKKHSIPILGVIFNGDPNPEGEEAILRHSGLPFLARLLPEASLTPQTIQKYARQWLPLFSKILL